MGGIDVGLWFLSGLLNELLWTEDLRWRVTFVLEKNVNLVLARVTVSLPFL
jgi:hypothetical protein